MTCQHENTSSLHTGPPFVLVPGERLCLDCHELLTDDTRATNHGGSMSEPFGEDDGTNEPMACTVCGSWIPCRQHPEAPIRPAGPWGSDFHELGSPVRDDGSEAGQLDAIAHRGIQGCTCEACMPNLDDVRTAWSDFEAERLRRWLP